MFLLKNDVSPKKEFWKSLSSKYSYECKYIRTKSGDSYRLQIEYNYKGINVSYNESDGKIFRCNFRINSRRLKIHFYNRA